MSIKDTVQSILGGSNDVPEGQRDASERPVSHVCQSCGEEYHSDPAFDIETCRRCGGVKVERA